MIIGPQTEIDSNLRKKNLDTYIGTIAQIVMKATKSKRQVNYKSTTDTDFGEVVETPFSVGVGLHVHKETRNKKVINFLSDLGLSVSYKWVLKIEHGLANFVVEKVTTKGGVFIPSSLELGIKPHFAIDSIDFKNNTPDVKSEFHGTTLVVFQSNPTQQRKLLKLSSCTSFKHTLPEPKKLFRNLSHQMNNFQPMDQKNAHWLIYLGIAIWIVFGVFAKLSKLKMYVLYQHRVHLTH